LLLSSLIGETPTWDSGWYTSASAIGNGSENYPVLNPNFPQIMRQDLPPLFKWIQAPTLYAQLIIHTVAAIQHYDLTLPTMTNSRAVIGAPLIPSSVAIGTSFGCWPAV
jgi:hypothetical protein